MGVELWRMIRAQGQCQGFPGVVQLVLLFCLPTPIFGSTEAPLVPLLDRFRQRRSAAAAAAAAISTTSLGPWVVCVYFLGGTREDGSDGSLQHTDSLCE